MKALVVRQPYAWAIVHAGKPETRDVNIRYRGPLAIVAAAEDDQDGWSTVYRVLRAHHPHLTMPLPAALVRRAVVGIANLVDCSPIVELLGASPVRRIAPGSLAWLRAARRRYALTFTHVVPVPGGRIHLRGMPGLFEVPRELEAILTPIYQRGTP